MKLNKEQKKKVWKYFLEQKREEIEDHFSFEYGFGGGYTAVSLLIALFLLGLSFYKEEPIKGTLIASLIIFGFLALIGLRALVRVIQDWIYENWKEATERVIKESKK